MNEKLPPLSGGRIEIHVQRHDTHELGHLTPEGREHARQMAEDKARRYLDTNPNTNFMVIASDQVLDEGEPGLGGIRAKETADEIVDVITKTLAERGLSSDQLFGFDTFPVTSSPTLREAKIFSNGFMRELQSKYKGEDLWSLYYQDVDAEMRKTMNAESSRDVAKRMDYIIKTAEMVGASFYKNSGNENFPLVVWIIGHGGGLGSYLHRYTDVPVDKLGFDVSEGFSVRLSPDNGVVVEVKGKEYPVNEDENIGLPE